MRLPIKLQENLTERERANFDIRFRGYEVRETVWRRHQSELNQDLSGWSGQNSLKRRVIHHRDRYGLIDNCFCVVEPYLFFHIRNCGDETEKYRQLVSDSMKEGGWKSNGHSHVLGDLNCDTRSFEFGNGYHCFELMIYHNPPSAETLNRPWYLIEKVGIRKITPRGNPTYLPISELTSEIFPAHVELGCGPSLAAGIPPLNYLHQHYGVQHHKQFLFEAETDVIGSFLSDFEGTLRKTSKIHHACLIAEPTPFYHGLKQLHDSGHIVGEIITSNFDRLPASVGLPEHYRRRFDGTAIYPEIEFREDTKTLLVIGCHADRRNVISQARTQGKQIIFIDPEGYLDTGASYPLESPQTGDIVINSTAEEAMEHFLQIAWRC